MRQNKRPTDPQETPFPPTLIAELDQVLRVLRERIAKTGASGHYLALVRLVEGLGFADWQKIAVTLDERNWLALPVDFADGLPLKALQDTLEELAFQRDHDTLTGLANRRLFNRQLLTEVQRALRTKTDLSLVMLDIDDFKSVNDTYGHPAGDQVLVRLSGLLSGSLRSYDVAARIGGEEFCLILPGASAWRAQNLTKRILDAFRAQVFAAPSGQSFSVTFSAGIATMDSHAGAVDAQELLSHADRGLYQAKGEGKNSITMFKPSRPVTENPALVQSAEKQFLFTGGK